VHVTDLSHEHRRQHVEFGQVGDRGKIRRQHPPDPADDLDRFVAVPQVIVGHDRPVIERQQIPRDSTRFEQICRHRPTRVSELGSVQLSGLADLPLGPTLGPSDRLDR